MPPMPRAPVESAAREKEQAEVQAVLAALPRSPLMARLFSFICDNYFAGRLDQLTEIKIAVEVFGRPETFDRNQDAIARVEAHRLRKKLKQYYETEGKYHELRIDVPPGSYVPVFRRAGATLSPGQDTTPRTGDAPPASVVADVLPVELPVPQVPLASTPSARPGRQRSYRWWYLAAACLAVVTAFSLLLKPLQHKSSNVTAAPASSAISPAAIGMGANGAVRFLCGYSGPPHIGRLGDVWGPDRYFTGGSAWTTKRGYLRRANDPFMFQTTRTGDFSYDIPVPPGIYELHLYFVETEYGEELGGGENTRTMQILLNGAMLFQSFDPLSDAAGPRIADERVFKDVQPMADGKVHLKFLSQRGQPIINAIALIPGIEHQQLPVRLVTQVNSYTDHAGEVWSPDNYYLGGQFFTDKPPVGGTQDPMMFTSERAGNFTYAIPADTRGTYTVKLHFAETYFGPEASGVGGAGSRVFNVTSDGVTLLDHFDIFREAGSLHAIEKTFHGLRPNPAGKLMLHFEPLSNYASVFGIEVLDETK
jgi:hypothetical protein